jgi:hypothetical protein
MNDTVLVALISAGSSALVAITALLLNYRGFASIDSRFASIDSRFASIEGRLDIMQADLKEFYRLLSEHDKRISRPEDKQ